MGQYPMKIVTKNYLINGTTNIGVQLFNAPTSHFLFMSSKQESKHVKIKYEINHTKGNSFYGAIFLPSLVR